MREPLRLRDDPSAPDEVRDLLRAFPGPKGSSGREPGLGARALRPMTAAERRRAAQRVMVIATLPVAAWSLTGVKGLALAAVLGIGGAVGVRAGADLLWRADSSGGAGAVERPPSSEGQAAAPEVPALGTAPLASERDHAALPPPAAEPTPTAPGESPALSIPAPSPDTLLEEVSLLEEARALVGSDPFAALAKLDAHRARFAGGKLGVERELIAVDALRRAGRFAEARARGEALLTRTEGSLYEERVRAILASLP